MGNSANAQREAIIQQRDIAGRNTAAEKLQQTSWFPKLDELKSALEGSVYLPTDKDYSKYHEARNRAWNKDQRGFPLVIVRVKHTADVSATVRFLRTHVTNISVCVASGCHSSKCMVTDTIVIDLVNINQVTYDQSSKLVHVGGGAYLQDIDNALEPHKRVVPIGTYPKTGVGGLTLGGGFGWLTRLFGQTVDQIVEAEVVLADGQIVVANDGNEYRDLVWGLRGGGGNFGVVTRFTFTTHELPPSVLSGTIVKLTPTQAAAVTVVANVDKAIADLPQHISGALILPAGAPVVVTFWNHFGTETNPSKVPIFNQAPYFGGWPTIENTVKKKNYYRELQHFTEPLNPEGFDYHTVIPFGTMDTPLPNQFIEDLVGFIRKSPPPKVEKAAAIIVFVAQDPKSFDGANDKTAVPVVIRRARYFAIVQAAWTAEHGEEGKAAAKAWVKSVFEILKPQITSNLYAPDEINTIKDQVQITGNVVGYTSDLLHRLSALKAKYDPENFFHMNANIKPAARK